MKALIPGIPVDDDKNRQHNTPSGAGLDTVANSTAGLRADAM